MKPSSEELKSLWDKTIDLLKQGRNIDAIREMKEYGFSLREAKELIETVIAVEFGKDDEAVTEDPLKEDFEKEADAYLLLARQEALKGFIGASYANLFRGLAVLMEQKSVFEILMHTSYSKPLDDIDWARLNQELVEMCDEKYPPEFSLGALRFVSAFKDRIPDWKEMVNTLHSRFKAKHKNADIIMRGLM